MFPRSRTTLALLLLATASPTAQAADEAAQQRAEIHRMCDEALSTLYAARPTARTIVARSAGYGCFSGFGVSLLLGGAGARGMVRDNASGEVVYMNMGQASAGLDIGIKDYREVLVFRDRETIQRFVESGWQIAGTANATLRVSDRGLASEITEALRDPIAIYPMTRAGLAAGVAAGGRRYWRDEQIN
ncbi:hypothetical protein GPA19_19500 [Azoarcus indigens]|uniref:Lipid-binding SYLF domain-containing protein n=1 Tax=Azoarcus indigens TaxID=29545 RepID=A0A4V3BM45_9RHOO|nr:YSC84-related protein [Azoarcus indigens]NMG67130.1 hypothetical protein [Azoarcus indigens]TDN48722.1 lipid-binding SYLF domain-containing protein [Azoarcus indigens]